jgi:metabolite-proton symporter
MTRTPPAPGALRRVAAASYIGTSLEWYDFFLYGTAAALVFNELFFPSFDPRVGTLAAFATYAVGFLARPLGAAVFGHFGDRIGRKAMLVITLVIMGVATAAIGLLPTYETAGVIAPVLLVVLRFVQGFAVGGEWGGAVLMAVEHAPDGRRGFFGSWPQLGSPTGLLLSTGIFSVFSALPEADFLAWGWRVPFLISVVLVAVGLFVRLRVVESPLFADVKEREAEVGVPIAEVLREGRRPLLLSIAAILVGIGGFYVVTTFMLSYATQEVGVDDTVILNAVTFTAVVELVATLPFAALSDRLGRRPVAGIGALCTGLMAFPLFLLVNTGEPALIWLGMGLTILAMTAHYAVISSFVAELYGTRVRYTGIGLSYQLSGAIGGAPAPLIASAR